MHPVLKLEPVPASASRRWHLRLAAAMLETIDTHPCAADRRGKLERLGVFDDWQQRPARYGEFLADFLSDDSIAEDAKQRLLTMGRPGPRDTRSFVLNHPLVAAEVFVALSQSACTEIVREQRLDAVGFRAQDVISALMREPRAVRNASISRIRQLTKASYVSLGVRHAFSL